ncbi:hypothetical protein [Streptomyces umbrinus]|uniref:hypothetical protein n=1 Tax=Streptomyces umbrinus TaxID=67370 RepID=UPI003C2F9413
MMSRSSEDPDSLSGGTVLVCAVDTRSHAPPEERQDERKKPVYRAAASAAAGCAEGPAELCVAGHAGSPAGEGGDELPFWKPELERVPLLSAREAEVFDLLGEGYSNRSAERELDITNVRSSFMWRKF